MNSTPQHDADQALAYPEPPAHPLWHQHGPRPRPVTAEQQRRNRDLLLLELAARPHRPLAATRENLRACRRLDDEVAR
ncbi:hypothetical protein ABT096_29470 [Streptomyces sp. NPDC002561]|uniref:hypothetical protein n=1 Tax=Streptomyces sp. NPDC002561 TaxID=3154418 RepID=UPI00332B72C0